MGIFERLAAGPGQLQQQDYNDWNQMVGSAPPDRFGRAAYNAARDADPQEYYQHTQPGVGGTDPFGALTGGRSQGLIGSLLGNLFNRGVGEQDIRQGTGLNTLDPNRMSPSDMAALAQWTQRNHPQAFGYTAAQYRDQPDLLQSLLGNKALMAMAIGLGAKLLSDRAARQRR
jgi:hypothetical protein